MIAIEIAVVRRLSQSASRAPGSPRLSSRSAGLEWAKIAMTGSVRKVSATATAIASSTGNHAGRVGAHVVEDRPLLWGRQPGERLVRVGPDRHRRRADSDLHAVLREILDGRGPRVLRDGQHELVRRELDRLAQQLLLVQREG